MTNLKELITKDIRYAHDELEELFPDVIEYGPDTIGEKFLCCKHSEYPDMVWSFVMTGYIFTVGNIYSLIYN
jgi:hypothetical protein